MSNRNGDCSHERPVNIKFTSTLTTDDENRLAPALLKALQGILDMFPIAYRVRIDTVDSHVYEMTGPSEFVAKSRPVAVPGQDLTIFDS
jgi:hypothetical protein